MFPSARVRKMISGDEVLASHGSREMPIWGPIFHQVEEDRDFGAVRLENLAKYLESIQSLGRPIQRLRHRGRSFISKTAPSVTEAIWRAAPPLLLPIERRPN